MSKGAKRPFFSGRFGKDGRRIMVSSLFDKKEHPVKGLSSDVVSDFTPSEIFSIASHETFGMSVERVNEDDRQLEELKAYKRWEDKKKEQELKSQVKSIKERLQQLDDYDLDEEDIPGLENDILSLDNPMRYELTMSYLYTINPHQYETDSIYSQYPTFEEGFKERHKEAVEGDQIFIDAAINYRKHLIETRSRKAFQWKLPKQDILDYMDNKSAVKDVINIPQQIVDEDKLASMQSAVFEAKDKKEALILYLEDMAWPAPPQSENEEEQKRWEEYRSQPRPPATWEEAQDPSVKYSRGEDTGGEITPAYIRYLRMQAIENGDAAAFEFEFPLTGDTA